MSFTGHAGGMGSSLRTVAARIGTKEGGLSMSESDVKEAMREFFALGWKKDDTRVEEAPPHIRKMTGRTTINPWWVSPEGVRVRGLKVALQQAARSLHPERVHEPSPLALRVVSALRQHPDVLVEVRNILNETTEVQAGSRSA